MRRVAVILRRNPRGDLTALACDGLETRATAAAVRCPWAALPDAQSLRAELRPHPVYTIEQWRLLLHVTDEGTQAAQATPVLLDLARAPGQGPHVRAGAEGASSSLEGAGGAMLCTLLEEVAALRAVAAEQSEEAAALRARVQQREAALEARIEQGRAAEAESLATLLPLLLAKQRRLGQLEEEVQRMGLELAEDELAEEEMATAYDADL